MSLKVVVAGVAALALSVTGSSVNGATIAYEGATPPTGLTVISTNATSTISATLAANNDYTDNAGPPGELFTPASNATLRSITVKLGGGANANNLRLLVGSVDTSTQAVTALNGTGTGITGGESATVPAALNDYVTFALANPIPLTAGTEYVFSLATGTGYIGVNRVTGTAAGAVNMNDTNTFENNNSGRPGKNQGFGQFATVNTGNYQYYYIAASDVPEPMSIGLLGVAATGLLLRRRRQVA